MKTSELTGTALDWAVAKCEGLFDQNVIFPNGATHKAVVLDRKQLYDMRTGEVYSPSTDWAQGGPILTNARISRTIDHSGQWIAYWTGGYTEGDEGKLHMQCDRSELVAGLRCYVASKLGDEIEIPDELAN